MKIITTINTDKCNIKMSCPYNNTVLPSIKNIIIELIINGIDATIETNIEEDKDATRVF